MKYEQQEIQLISREQLVDRARDFAARNWRLVQICSTVGDPMEITYSFDKDGRLCSLRLSLARADAVLPSITGHYLAAFGYENELQDLFGITVTDLALNFNGNFYKLAVKTPMAARTPAQAG